MTDDDDAPPLPGLELVDTDKASALELAVRRTIADLRSSDLLTERDAGRLQLAVELAKVINSKQQTKRTSTLSNDARLLDEILTGLAGEVDVDAESQKMLDRWGEVIARAEADASTQIPDAS